MFLPCVAVGSVFGLYVTMACFWACELAVLYSRKQGSSFSMLHSKLVLLAPATNLITTDLIMKN